jgi:hypothetical protein
MVSLTMAREPEHSVLASIPGPAAVGRGKGFQKPVPRPELSELPADDPFRVEWLRALRE